MYPASELKNYEHSSPCEQQDLGSTVAEAYKYLWFGGNRLSGTIPPELVLLKALRSLALWGNPLSGSIPTVLGQLSELEILSISASHVAGRIPSELGLLRNLRILHFMGDRLSGSIPSELGLLSHLIYISVDSNVSWFLHSYLRCFLNQTSWSLFLRNYSRSKVLFL
jgi:hypothetical protein